MAKITITIEDHITDLGNTVFVDIDADVKPTSAEDTTEAQTLAFIAMAAIKRGAEWMDGEIHTVKRR